MNNSFEFEGNGLTISREEWIRLFHLFIVTATILIILSINNSREVII